MYAFVAGVIPPSPCSGSSMIAASVRFFFSLSLIHI